MGEIKAAGSAADRALHILEHVIESGQAVSVTELADAVQLPRPTVYRLARLLENRGFLLKDIDDRKYVPGPQMEDLAFAMLQRKLGTAPRRIILERLAEQAKEACNISMLDGHRLTYIDRVDMAWPLRMSFDVGSHVPIHCTASGKLLLALQRKRVRQRIIQQATLKPLTEQTITDPDQFEAALEEIRQRKFGTDDQEFLAGMLCIAVPVEPPDGLPIVAVSIHAPIFRHSLRDLEEFLPQLRKAANELSDLFYANAGADGKLSREENARPQQHVLAEQSLD